MAKREEYKQRNIDFLKEISQKEEVQKHPSGVMYQVIQQGGGTQSPNLRSIVSVHYRGTLINGREFDNSWERGCPEALRLSDVIEGWQIALQQMHVGDRWLIYIPSELGYGNRPSGPIPAYSTLIFDVELLNVF